MNYRLRKTLLKILTVFILLFSAAGLYGAVQEPAARKDQGQETPSEFLICFELPLELKERAEVKKELKANIKKIFSPAKDRHFMVIETKLNRDTLRKKLGNLGFKVKYAEPVLERQLAYIPNDPHFSLQWNLSDVGAPQAWDIEDGTVNEPVIAILDTGADLDHAELKTRLWVNADEIPANGVDDDRNGYIDDVYGLNVTGINQKKMDAYVYLGTSYGIKAAQTIYAKGETINSLTFRLAKIGNPAVPVKVEILDGTPDQGSVIASASISAASISSYHGDVTFTFSRPVKLQKDKTYSFVLSAAGTDDENFYLVFDTNYESSEDDVFIRGEEWLFNYGGSGRWLAYRADLYFKISPKNNPYDDEGHGTVVSSIAAAETNNAYLIAGAAPGARLMIVKVSGSGAINTADWVEGLYYAVNNGARVINMSFSGTAFSQAEEDAVSYALSKGCVLAAAAGNNGQIGIFYPAGYDGVLGISSYNTYRQLSAFSNRGDFIDLAGPGEDILSVSPSYQNGALSLAVSYGTSMSTPHISAAAALLFSLQPELIGNTVEKILKSTAVDLGPPGRDSSYGYGAVNFYNALSLASTPAVVRFAGTDRYHTSAMISAELFPEATAVVIATGENFPDSLSAGPLAAALKAPLLLTRKSYLPQKIEAEIKRLGSIKAYIIGGTGAVSFGVENYLKNQLGLSVERIAGRDRYETAVRVALKLEQLKGNPDVLFVATGKNYPDGLSAAPYAGALGAPVLFVKDEDVLPHSVQDWIKDRRLSTIYIFGGIGAVNQNIEAALISYADKVIRFGGIDRYETNYLAAEHFLKNSGFSRNVLFVSTGENFPDSLCSGSPAAGNLSAVILVKPSYYLKPSTLAALNLFGPVNLIYVAGGEGAVPRTAVSRAFEEIKF